MKGQAWLLELYNDYTAIIPYLLTSLQDSVSLRVTDLGDSGSSNSCYRECQMYLQANIQRHEYLLMPIQQEGDDILISSSYAKHIGLGARKSISATRCVTSKSSVASEGQRLGS